MKCIKQSGWVATSASLLLWATMTCAQAGGAYPGQTGPGQRGTMGAPGQPGTPGYPGQPGTMTDAQTNGQMGSQVDDKTFMKKAAEGGLAEVQLGQLAQQNGQSQDVKNFGQKMVTDHTKANDQLKQVASQEGVTLPTDVSSKDRAEYDRMSKLNGEAFDKAYARMMVSDHKKDVAEFQREANSGSDPQMKNFASQTLPTLQDHLRMAEQMNSSVKSEGNSTKSGSSSQ